MQSSFLFKTDNSTNFENSGQPKPEITIQSNLETLMKINSEKQKQEFIKEQTALKQKLINSESQSKILNDQISKLQKELRVKTDIAIKCVTLEKKLKESQATIKQMETSLKSIETSRANLTKQLEEKINKNLNSTVRLSLNTDTKSSKN